MEKTETQCICKKQLVDGVLLEINNSSYKVRISPTNENNLRSVSWGGRGFHPGVKSGPPFRSYWSACSKNPDKGGAMCLGCEIELSIKDFSSSYQARPFDLKRDNASTERRGSAAV